MYVVLRSIKMVQVKMGRDDHLIADPLDGAKPGMIAPFIVTEQDWQHERTKIPVNESPFFADPLYLFANLQGARSCDIKKLGAKVTGG